MIDYTMPVLSEQERAHLILSCREEIEDLQTLISGYSDPIFLIDRLRRQQIALAALTAKPVDPADCFCQVYLAPPVPVKQEGDHRD